MEIKIGKDGKITIPKYFRDKYNLNHGIALILSNSEDGILLSPVAVCSLAEKRYRKSFTNEVLVMIVRL